MASAGGRGRPVWTARSARGERAALAVPGPAFLRRRSRLGRAESVPKRRLERMSRRSLGDENDDEPRRARAEPMIGSIAREAGPPPPQTPPRRTGVGASFAGPRSPAHAPGRGFGRRRATRRPDHPARARQGGPRRSRSWSRDLRPGDSAEMSDSQSTAQRLGPGSGRDPARAAFVFKAREAGVLQGCAPPGSSTPLKHLRYQSRTFIRAGHLCEPDIYVSRTCKPDIYASRTFLRAGHLCEPYILQVSAAAATK